MQGRAPEVFLHQYSWNLAKWLILCQCDVKPNQNKTNKVQFRYNSLFKAKKLNKHLVISLYQNLSTQKKVPEILHKVNYS
jgi:hypothetical protein